MCYYHCCCYYYSCAVIVFDFFFAFLESHFYNLLGVIFVKVTFFLKKLFCWFFLNASIIFFFTFLCVSVWTYFKIFFLLYHISLLFVFDFFFLLLINFFILFNLCYECVRVSAKRQKIWKVSKVWTLSGVTCGNFGIGWKIVFISMISCIDTMVVL